MMVGLPILHPPWSISSAGACRSTSVKPNPKMAALGWHGRILWLSRGLFQHHLGSIYFPDPSVVCLATAASSYRAVLG